MDYCEACRVEAVTVVDKERSSSIPYRLCSDCYHRLTAHSLRPLEYFNLVALHGHEYYLNGDFYEDNGVACQPRDTLEQDDRFRFPDLSSIQDNLQRLVDYSIVKWWYPVEVTPYLGAFSSLDILRELDIRLHYNPMLLERLLDISAEVLKTEAQDWLIFQYKNFDGDDLLVFAKAIAACLPLNKGFDLVVKSLEDVEESQLPAKIWALSYFNSPKALTWIEQHQAKIKNVPNHFGDVCAANQFDWPTAVKWLKMGRPLSLIALDAILACGTTADKLNRSYYLRSNPPRLVNPDDELTMNAVLEEFLKTDNVHRTRTVVAAIKRDWKDIKKIPPTQR